MPVLGDGLERHQLGFPQFGAVGRILAAVAERGDLHEAEGEIALAPVGPPVGDHRGKERAVLIRRGDVRLALIPDRAADGVGNQRGDHAVVETRRLALPASGFSAGLASSVLRLVQNSAGVPPHEVSIRPTGTFNSLCNWRPK